MTAAPDAPALADDLAQRLDASFARGSGHGLLQLGAAEAETPLPAAFAYWREFGSRYMSAVCGHPVPPESRTHEPVQARRAQAAREFLDILNQLHDRRVDCVIVGGVAAALHGGTRVTFDLDVVPALAPESYRRL